MIPIPKIALVGRPNVGKSTLFNRICGRRKAITDNRPGSTRDRNYAQTSWQGAAFELIDTGGLLLGTDDPLLGPAVAQADLAITEADLIIFVVDGRAGLLPDDRAIAKSLRKKGKRVLVAVNKLEKDQDALEEFAPLGFDQVHGLSAEHGLGVGDLLDAALEGLPKAEIPEDEEKPLRLAIVGRPNVGKSSLLNRFLGEERAVVSPIPGTTRDVVDSLVTKEGQRFLFVDTAGIRKSKHLDLNVDHVSVVQSRRAIDRADVALLVIDTVEGMREMDATIGGYVHEAGRGIVVVVNKWDLSPSGKTKEMETRIRDSLKFLAYAPIVFTSAKDGRGLAIVLKTALRVYQSSRQRIATGPLNRALQEAAARHPPKAAKGNKSLRILFATQIGAQPPTFVLSLNHAEELHFSYQRYLENQLREAFGFEGTPIVLRVRVRRH